LPSSVMLLRGAGDAASYAWGRAAIPLGCLRAPAARSAQDGRIRGPVDSRHAPQRLQLGQQAKQEANQRAIAWVDAQAAIERVKGAVIERTPAIQVFVHGAGQVFLEGRTQSIGPARTRSH